MFFKLIIRKKLTLWKEDEMKKMLVGVMVVFFLLFVVELVGAQMEILNPATVKEGDIHLDLQLDPDGANTTYSQIRVLYKLDDKTAFKYSRFGQAMEFMFKDYQQTLDIKNHPGMYEMNPVLGKHPSDTAISAYFIAVNAIIFTAVKKLPEPWASSVADSVTFMEKLVTEDNDRTYRGARAGAMPMGIVFTLRF